MPLLFLSAPGIGTRYSDSYSEHLPAVARSRKREAIITYKKIRPMIQLDNLSIIRKTKCFDFWERNVLFPKTKRSFFRTPTPLPCPFPLNFSLLIITKKFGNLAKNRYICIV